MGFPSVDAVWVSSRGGQLPWEGLRLRELVSRGGLLLCEESRLMELISRGGKLRALLSGCGMGNSSHAFASCLATSALSGSMAGSMAGSCFVSQFRSASWGVGRLATRSGGTECTFQTHPPFCVQSLIGSR